MFELRDYQQETIDNIMNSISAGHRSIMVQQPPRTGKTVIMAEIARRATAKGNRILFVVHRQEIVQQVIKTFEACYIAKYFEQQGFEFYSVCCKNCRDRKSVV